MITSTGFGMNQIVLDAHQFYQTADLLPNNPTMQHQPSKSNEELIKEFAKLYDSDNCLYDKQQDYFAKALAAKDAEREKAVEERDRQWRNAIRYIIDNSEGSQDWFNALRACKSIQI